MAKLSNAQRQVLATMVKNNIAMISYYKGPPGAEGRGAGYFYRRAGRPINANDPRSSTVEALARLGMLREDGDFILTAEGADAGRAALQEAGRS